MPDDKIISFAAAGSPNAPMRAVHPSIPIPVNIPDNIPQIEIEDLGFEDIGAAFNMRGWLQKACEAQGARMTGGGFGGGVADIDIDLDGCHFNLTIKALSRP